MVPAAMASTSQRATARGVGERRAVRVRDRHGVHRGVHLAGVHRREANTGAGQLGGPSTARVLERGLRRAVGSPARIRLDGGVGRHVEHEPASAQDHRPADRLGEPEGADRVDREGALVVFAVCVEQEAQRRRAERARVVHEQVHGPHEARGRPGDAMDRLLVPDVLRQRVRLSTRRPDARRRGIERLAPARHQHDARPSRRELRAQRFAQTAAPSVTMAPVPRRSMVCLLVSSMQPSMTAHWRA